MILLALNELNINYIQGYIKKGYLSNFKVLLHNGYIKTTSEVKYENLEPWIQWATVQTGLTYSEHKLFRLGDIVERKDLYQIFEDLEDSGFSVGAISPFNADNRLNKSNFFIPDPWTQTKSSGGFLISKLSRTISKFVNNNASGGISLMNPIWLLTGFFRYVRVKRWGKFLNLLLYRNKPGVKAAILDMILLEVFVTLHSKNKPDYSHLFFNGGAHVQHHYLFNSTNYKGSITNPEWYCPKDWDPLLMILKTYDRIIGDLLLTGERILGVTGLHQTPHNEETFYWRPTCHHDLLMELGVSINFKVIPRMSRDFLIELNSDEESKYVENILNTYKDSKYGLNVFTVDNRGKSLFVEINYDKDIDDNIIFEGNNGIVISNLSKKFAFVAIKNGKHDGTGYVFSNKKINLPKTIELKDMYKFIKETVILDHENKNKK
jgi:hypothetical protein